MSVLCFALRDHPEWSGGAFEVSSLKVVILSGGAGNVMAGDTQVGPKPLLEIGGRTILSHVMSHYAHFGFDHFIVAVGHRGNMIKDYLTRYHLNQHDIRVDVRTGVTESLSEASHGDWFVDVIDTGQTTGTAGRLLRLAPLLGTDTFLVTFGDSVSDVDLSAVLDVHRSNGRMATITVVHPQPRFGELQLVGDRVDAFSEKPLTSSWINGGYMVMEPAVFDYIAGDEEPLSPGPLEKLTAIDQLAAYQHTGFWHGVDTLRDKELLDAMAARGSAPWELTSR